jgi:hypothetical protein
VTGPEASGRCLRGERMGRCMRAWSRDGVRAGWALVPTCGHLSLGLRGQGMAVVRDLSRAQLAFEVSAGDPDQFLVVRFRARGLCQLYGSKSTWWHRGRSHFRPTSSAKRRAYVNTSKGHVFPRRGQPLRDDRETEGRLLPAELFPPGGCSPSLRLAHFSEQVRARHHFDV